MRFTTHVERIFLVMGAFLVLPGLLHGILRVYPGEKNCRTGREVGGNEPRSAGRNQPDLPHGKVNMRILVDADACPVKEIIVRLARSRSIHVVMICDTNHVIRDGYSEVITVDQARDSVDLALANRLKPSDIVVTQDFGVAALALGKGCWALNQNGMVYDDGNMDQLLLERHNGQKIRRAGGRTKGMKKRDPEDDDKFEAALIHMLDANL